MKKMVKLVTHTLPHTENVYVYMQFQFKKKKDQK